MEVGLSPAILAQVCGKADLRKKLSFEILPPTHSLKGCMGGEGEMK